MRIERPIFWHQGLFLQPQHFQLQEQALISRLYPFQQHLAPHFWGVGKLEIDETLLATGSFGLHSGSFLFADGSYLTFPGNALLHPRSLAGCPLEGKPPQLYAGISAGMPTAKT